MQDQIIQALRQNQADQAVQLAQAWTRDEPGQAGAHRWLALALQQQGKAEDAMEALQQALQLAPMMPSCTCSTLACCLPCASTRARTRHWRAPPASTRIPSPPT